MWFSFILWYSLFGITLASTGGNILAATSSPPTKPTDSPTTPPPTGSPTTSAPTPSPTAAPILRLIEMEQRLDHFAPDYTLGRNFTQRMWVSWPPSNPGPSNVTTLFFLVGDTQELVASEMLLSEPARLAQAEDAYFAALEHRFYGQSRPFDWYTPDNLTMLSVDQALEDISAALQWIMEDLGVSTATVTGAGAGAGGQSDSGPPAFRVVVAGCSYAGQLAAWFRYKFPHQAFAALACSAPVKAKVDFFELDEAVTESLGFKCSRAVAKATAEVQRLVAKDPAGTLAKFGCQDLSGSNPVDFLYVMADVVAWAVATDSSEQLQAPMCYNFTRAGPKNDYLPWVYENYARLAFRRSGRSCADWALTGHRAQAVLQNQPSDYLRAWTWQSCTQLGYFQTAPPKPHFSLRSRWINVTYHLAVCKQLFGGGRPFAPQAHRINRVYGGAKHYGGSRVVFVNGLNDPWRTLGVQKPLAPDVPSIMVANASHCATWPNGTEGAGARATAELRARKLVAAYLRYFLDPGTVCGKCANNATCIVAPVPPRVPGSGGSDSITGRCHCPEGWHGVDCDVNLWLTASLYVLLIAAGVALVTTIFGVLLGRFLTVRFMRRSASAKYDRLVN